jgi:co-chaperonin GroES (HSP10)
MERIKETSLSELMEVNPELFDFDRIYSKQSQGQQLTREEAMALCDAPAPMHFQLKAYNPGPAREDRALILARYVSADQQIGRILVPDTAQRTSGEMIVIDTGKGCWDDMSQTYVPLVNLAVGDRIVVGKYVGQDIELNFDIPTGDPNLPSKRVSMKFTCLMVKNIMAKYEAGFD